MKLAAIIPTCDRPAMLARALASVRRQNRRPDQVIVVNDGQAPVEAPGATVIAGGPHGGPGLARNLGARHADADALLFLDDDDEWDPTYVKAADARLRQHDLVLTRFEKIDRHGHRSPEKLPPDRLEVRDWLVRNQGLRGANLAIRRDAFLALGGFDELLSCGEDMDLAIRAAEARLNYGRIEAPLVIYHSHSGPRLTSPGPRHRQAHRTWMTAQGPRLSACDAHAYRARTGRLFGVDPGPPPRLVWVLGPPGAGKTTWAQRRAGTADRVLDIDEVFFWRDGADLGVRTAKRHVARALRAVEHQRPSDDRRLFVTAAYLDPEDLGELTPAEHVVAVVPPEPEWRRRLFERDGQVPLTHAADHARWVSRFGVGAHAADLQPRRMP